MESCGRPEGPDRLDDGLQLGHVLRLLAVLLRLRSNRNTQTVKHPDGVMRECVNGPWSPVGAGAAAGPLASERREQQKHENTGSELETVEGWRRTCRTRRFSAASVPSIILDCNSQA